MAQQPPMMHKDFELQTSCRRKSLASATFRRYAAGVGATAESTHGLQAPCRRRMHAGECWMRLRVAIACCLMTCTGFAACSTPSRDKTKPPASDARDGRATLVNYHNGLSDDDRTTFYHLSEGSEMIPLALLQALERTRIPPDPQGEGLVPFMANLAPLRLHIGREVRDEPRRPSRWHDHRALAPDQSSHDRLQLYRVSCR